MKHFPSIFSYALLWGLAFLFYLHQPASAQQKASSSTAGIYVDDNGVLRRSGSEEEITGFGVNYTVPFAHAYRSAVKLGVDPLKAIDQDVYHFARLGFDLYRVHVWDTEISDTLGNLRYNEHLHAFDYLLKKLGERNINYVLTPIAYWGNGWPEPDEPTPGFSHKYGKDACLTDPEAIKAQENYLFQFLNHVNPYTGIAYKDDPRLLAVEVSNEPHHREAPEQVTAFVRRMVEAIRKTGCQKPVFYNASHSVHLADHYFQGGIQGGTFQWYPTGLGYQRELPGNFLPNVDRYHIPFEETIKKHGGAKIVYEFDAADVGRSYPYPAMARSFRTAGIQLATHFSYDPMFLAYANTEYNTHHMNLAYTPAKALSLKICSEVFHRIPMYQDYGNYPGNTSFEGFTVSYDPDLAMLNVAEKYFYTNDTPAPPADEKSLEHLAGHGSSPVVTYEGSGAYFLDRLESGVWRLEVMPDVLIIDNPYGRNGLEKEVAVIQWNERRMHIRLQDLGRDFRLIPLDEKNTCEPTVDDGRFVVCPGAYLVVRAGVQHAWKTGDTWGNIRLGEFHAPESSVHHTYVVHEPVAAVIAETPLTISAKIISPDTSVKVQAWVNTDRRGRTIDLERVAAFTYEATLPADQVEQGFLHYYLIVEGKDGPETFPAGKPGRPFRWDFYDRQPYTVRVISKDQPINLFNALEDGNRLSRKWLNTLKLAPTDNIHEAEYQINIEHLFEVDQENLNGPVIHEYSIRHYLRPKIEHLRPHLAQKQKLVLRARALNDQPVRLQIALLTRDGTAYGKVIEIGPELQDHEIDIADLKKVRTVLLPRPYPTFLPYYFPGSEEGGLRLEEIESVQWSIGPGIPEDQLEEKHGIALVSLDLE